MSEALLAVFGVVASLAGAVLLYLASPNQRVTPRPTGRRDLVIVGGVAKLVALLAFLAVAGPATAVFIWLTLAMLVWSSAPLLTVWRDAKRKPHR